MPPVIKIRCPLCGHLVFVQNFERGPYPLEAFEVSGLGRGRGFSHRHVEVNPSVRVLVAKKLKEISQYLERVIEQIVISVVGRAISREVWLPLWRSRVVKEYTIPIGGGVRVERG